MKQVGNTKSNAIYNPDEIRHPPPTNFIDSERDSELEKYIRGKSTPLVRCVRVALTSHSKVRIQILHGGLYGQRKLYA